MCTFNILYDLKDAYRNIRKKYCLQEQQQEMLAQASTVVFTTGLPGRPPTTQFPAIPTEQDTGCRARRTARKYMVSRPGYSSPAGRHEKLPAAQAGHETDMISHLCRRDRRHYCTFDRCHACRSRPQFVQLSTIHDRTAGGGMRH
jgi:hypothetical protein